MTDAEADPIAAEAREIAKTPRSVAREIIMLLQGRTIKAPAQHQGTMSSIAKVVEGFGLRMKSAGRAEASAWRPISECPENLRIYVYGWHRDHEPPYDEEAMAWKDQIDGKFYYAPQGGVIDWTPTHFAELMGAPLPPTPEGGE